MHTQTSDLPHSPHDITQPLRTKPHPTYSSPHPPLVPSTPQSRPSTQRARNFCSIVFPKYSSQSRARARTSLTAEWALRSVNPQPWRFTNNSLGVPHAQSFSVCLSSWVCVVCVCFLFYLSDYLNFVRCLFSVLLHIHFTFLNFQTYKFMNMGVHIALLIWLYLSTG